MHVTRHNITTWQREMSVVLQQRIPTNNTRVRQKNLTVFKSLYIENRQVFSAAPCIITCNILYDSVLRAVEIYYVKNRNIQRGAKVGIQL